MEDFWWKFNCRRTELDSFIFRFCNSKPEIYMVIQMKIWTDSWNYFSRVIAYLDEAKSL